MVYKSRKKKKGRALHILIVLFLVFFVFSIGKVLFTLLQARKEAEAFDTLASMISSSQQPDSSVQAESIQEGADVDISLPDTSEHTSPYQVLADQNADFFGWLAIPGTSVNYPVMFTPDNPEYYLRRAFDGSDSQSGVPFLDGSWWEDCGNYLIYGHNMNNGTMFHDLLQYMDESFCQQHPTIRFDTLEQTGVYEVVAAFSSRVYSQNEEGGFRYYQYADLSDPDRFAEFIEGVEQAALYETGVQAEYGDQLLTLSTCSEDTKDGRFVVVAKEITQ